VKYLYSILVLLVPFCLSAQDYNRPVPPNFPLYEFQINDSVNVGYYTICPYSLKRGDTLNQGMALLDNEGYIAWFRMDSTMYFHELKFYKNHRQFSFITSSNGIDFQRIVMDTAFTSVDSIGSTFNYLPDMHEYQILNNGNRLTLDRKDSTFDLSAYTFAGNVKGTTTACRSFVIKEIDTGGNTIFEWSSTDYIHPTECIDSIYSYNKKSFDYAHGNSVDEDTDGNFIVSLRNTNSIVKINRKTGKVIWRLGGKLNEFKLVNDTVWFSGQHDVRRLPNGNISIFDNMFSKEPQAVSSRALELKLDTVNMTATKVWEYRYSPGFHVPRRGSHQKIANGFRLINYGESFRPNPNFALLNPQDSVSATLSFIDSTVTYRARIAALPYELNRPEIRCNTIEGKMILSAPSGYENYLWNTGDTTAFISVSDTGTYQVWVNHGIGMLGSHPFFLTDPKTQCLSEPSTLSEKATIIGIYDQDGKVIVEPEADRIYIVRYSDQSSALVWWNEAMQEAYLKSK
jgi:hypothetical protein